MTAAPTVLWDFDGTLAFRADRWRGALLAALDAVDPTHQVSLDQLRQGLRDGFLWHTPEQPHPHLDTPDRWWGHHASLFLQTYLDAGIDEPAARRAASAVRSAYLDPAAWTVYEDVLPALRRLQAHGWQNVVLSNHVPELSVLVEQLGLAGVVNQVLTSAVTGYEKPHPAMYVLARHVAGDPRVMWMVGDNPVADVAGARAAGIPALLVRTPDADGRVLGLADAVDRILAAPGEQRG